MLALDDVQTAFVTSVLGGATAPPLAGIITPSSARLDLYRNTVQGTLQKALAATYPTVLYLVGEDFFAGLTQAYITAQPPTSAYLNLYGEGLAGFVKNFPAAASVIYLPDVARLEWAVALASNAPDAEALDGASFAALGPAAQEALRVMPHPTLQRVTLEYPAETLWQCVIEERVDQFATLDFTPRDHVVMIVRLPSGLVVQSLSALEDRLLMTLLSGISIGQAIPMDTAPENLTFFARLLAIHALCPQKGVLP